MLGRLVQLFKKSEDGPDGHDFFADAIASKGISILLIKVVKKKARV